MFQPSFLSLSITSRKNFFTKTSLDKRIISTYSIPNTEETRTKPIWYTEWKSNSSFSNLQPFNILSLKCMSCSREISFEFIYKKVECERIWATQWKMKQLRKRNPILPLQYKFSLMYLQNDCFAFHNFWFSIYIFVQTFLSSEHIHKKSSMQFQ